VTGEGLKFDPLQRGLTPVWDMQAEGFRMVNLETVLDIRLEGQEYEVVQPVTTEA